MSVNFFPHFSHPNSKPGGGGGEGERGRAYSPCLFSSVFGKISEGAARDYQKMEGFSLLNLGEQLAGAVTWEIRNLGRWFSRQKKNNTNELWPTLPNRGTHVWSTCVGPQGLIPASLSHVNAVGHK